MRSYTIVDHIAIEHDRFEFVLGICNVPVLPQLKQWKWHGPMSGGMVGKVARIVGGWQIIISIVILTANMYHELIGCIVLIRGHIKLIVLYCIASTERHFRILYNTLF